MTSRTDFRITEFPLSRAFYRATQLLRHGLHPVADAEHRNAKLEHHLRRAPFLCLVYGIRPTRENDSLRIEVTHELLGDIERMELAIDLLLTHPTRDELGYLRTEIEDENFLVSHFLALKEQGRLLEPPLGT